MRMRSGMKGGLSAIFMGAVLTGCSPMLVANPNMDPCIEQKAVGVSILFSSRSMSYSEECARRRTMDALSTHPDPGVQALALDMATRLMAGDDPARQQAVEKAKDEAAALYIKAVEGEKANIKRELLQDMSAHPVACTVADVVAEKDADGNQVFTLANCAPLDTEPSLPAPQPIPVWTISEQQTPDSLLPPKLHYPLDFQQ